MISLCKHFFIKFFLPLLYDSIDLQLKERGSLLNKIDKNMSLLISKTHDVKKEIECLKD